MSQTKCDYFRIAQDHIARQYPSFDPTGLAPIITDSGKTWELADEPPKGMLGGTPVITIDKESCLVVRARHEQ